MKNKYHRVGLGVAVLAVMIFAGFLSFFSAKNVLAEEMPEYRLAIAPTQEYWEEFEVGKSYVGQFEIRNTGKQELNFEAYVAPYSVASETYEPNFSDETQYTEITKWIELEANSGKIASGDKFVMNYRINVPEDAHGGMQAGTIMVSMKGDADEGNVQTVRRLGYLVYGNVDGDVIKTGKVIENKIPSFLFTPPIKATSVVENTGNVYTVAQYSMQVFPLFSDEEIYTNEETPEGNVVFPETKKLNTVSWEGAPQLGIFRVRQTVKIFDEESVTEKLVFLCPLWFLFIVILLVFCIIFWIVSRVIKRKKENY